MRRGRDRGGRSQDEPSPTQEPAKRPGHPSSELDVAPPELDYERLAGRERGERRGKPVCVDEVGVPRSSPRRTGERGQEESQKEHTPWPMPEIADDPVAVRDPEVAEGRRRNDADIETGGAQVLDRVPDEDSGDVVREARVRRRQHDDLQATGGARRANTTGIATASAAKT